MDNKELKRRLKHLCFAVFGILGVCWIFYGCRIGIIALNQSIDERQARLQSHPQTPYHTIEMNNGDVVYYRIVNIDGADYIMTTQEGGHYTLCPKIK